MDMQSLMAKINEAKKSFVRNERPVKPKMGQTEIVLLPGWNPANRETFWREFGAHYIRNAQDKVVAYYPCEDVINHAPCPVCEKLAELSKTNDEGLLEQIKKSRANREFLVNAIVLNDNNNEPVVMSFSTTAFEQLISHLAMWGQAVFDETNPQIISVMRTGTGYDTKYTVTITPNKFTLPAGTYAKMKDLDKYVDQKTDALLQKSLTALGAVTGASAVLTHQEQPALIDATTQVEDVKEAEPWAGSAPIQTWMAPPTPVQTTQAPQPVAPQPVMAQPQPMMAQPQAPAQNLGLDTDMQDILASLEDL